MTYEEDYEDEKFFINFGKRPPIWVVQFYLTRWCDSYSSPMSIAFTFLKDFVCYDMALFNEFEQIEKIHVLVRKPRHRLDYENKKIQEFKEFVMRRFKRFKPTFEKVENVY